MTDSEYQAAYTDSRTLLLSLRIGNFASAAASGDAEEQALARLSLSLTPMLKMLGDLPSTV
jgi:hypothetical protein